MKTITLIVATLVILLQAALLFAVPPQSVNYTNGMDVRCSVIEGDNIWIGTMGGLVKMNRLTQVMTFYNVLNSGLPDNQVNCIAIDNLGKKWIGTAYGLASFDGISWVIYDASNSGIGINYISAIAIDTAGTKWIGGDGCLVRYNGLNWTVYNSSDTYILYSRITGIAIDNEGTKWLGTGDNEYANGVGLISFNGDSWNVYNTQNSGIGGNQINNLGIDASGKLWLCHSFLTNDNADILGRGLSKFDNGNWTVFTTENSGLPNDEVSSIAFAPANMQWIGTANGLVSFDGTIWHTYNVPVTVSDTNFIGNISVDTQGNKWLGGIDGNLSGLIRYNGTAWLLINPSNSGMPTNNVNDLMIDPGNMKWMASEKGLIKFDGIGWDVYNTQSTSMPYGKVNCVAEDAQGVLWLGIGNKLVKYNGSSWNVELDYFASITSIAIGTQDVIWVGVDDQYYGGLIRYSPANISIYNEENSGLPGRQVQLLECDAQGVVWLSSRNDVEANGLTSFDGNNWTTYNRTNSPIPGNVVTGIAFDTSGAKWIGTDNGLARLISSSWTTYTSSNSALPSNRINAIAIDANGDKWLSSGGYSEAQPGSKLVRMAGNVFTTFESAVPKGRSFNLISTDANGNKWLASKNDALGLVLFYEGSVHNEDVINQMPTADFRLSSYPNPFASQTNISFELKQADKVELSIYNMKGQLVKTLFNETLSVGQHSYVWDGTDSQTNRAAKGIYLCKLITSSGTSTRKLIRLQK